MIASVDIYDQAGTTVQHRVRTLLSARWLDELDDPGSFSIEVPTDDLVGTGVGVGSIVKFAIGATSQSYVWAGVVETLRYDKAGQGVEGDQVANLSGRGVRALLEDALVWPTDTETNRQFTSENAGAIFKTLFDEAQVRGALTDMSLGFTPPNDSNGNAFTETLTIDEAVGNTLLSVAARHQELAVDVWVDTDLQVHYVNARGTDLTTGSNPTVLRTGENVTELTRETAGPIRNTVLAAYGVSGGGTQYDDDTNAGSVSTYGRRETFLSLTSTADTGAVALAMTGVLTSNATPADGSTIEVANVGAVPYIDFGLGDTVLLADPSGNRDAYKVRAITVQIDDAGNITFVPELGTARANLNKRLKNALARLERATGESVVATGDLGAIAGDFGFALGGGAELDYGTVQTYTISTRQGTVDIDGTVYNFENATGFGLAVGDVIIVTDVGGLVDKVAVGIYSRVGSYTPTVLSNPQAVSGFPFDGDQLPNQFNYTLDISGIVSLYSDGTFVSAPAAWYGSGILGYAGRVVAYLARTNDASTFPPIVFYNVETGASTSISRTPGAGPSRSLSVAAVGDRLFVSYLGTTGNCIESYDTTTGVWTTHAVQYAIFAGVSDGRAWWIGKMSGEASPTVWRIISIDGSGTLSHRLNPQSTTTTTSVFARAKNGKMYYRINTSGALLYNFDTNVAAASTSITNSAAAPATLPYTNSGTFSHFEIHTRSYTNSDIAANGDCYYLLRTGTPTTAGFAILDETTLAATTYTQITSATGAQADGEAAMLGGLQLAGTQVVLYGAVREDVADALGRTTSYIPAYWRTDGVTTVRVDDTSYVGLLPDGAGSGDCFARAAVIHKGTVDTDIIYHKNMSASNTGTGSTADDANASGPAWVESQTI